MAMAAILFFRIRPKIVRYALFYINILCKFGEFMFINEGGMKGFAKPDERTDGQCFIISRARPISEWDIIMHLTNINVDCFLKPMD